LGSQITEVEQAIVERNIVLGIDLLALRNAAGSNREFARMVRHSFDIDPARAAWPARHHQPVELDMKAPAAVNDEGQSCGDWRR
jgi:hypothetical protein